MANYITTFDTHAEYESATTLQYPNVSVINEDMSVIYAKESPEPDYSQDYFTMVVTVGGNVTWNGTNDNALSYSTDDGETWSTASSNITLPVNEGDKVLWKGTTTPIEFPPRGIGNFSGDTNVRYSVQGNAMSLLYGNDFKGQTSLADKRYALYGLFNNNTNVTSAKNLSLPATTLVYGCYSNMFYKCTSLTTAPELPATTLANECYFNMFNGCTSLSSIKCLATDISAYACTQNWVQNVAASGTFTKAASMSDWTEGTSGIPEGWEVEDA